MGSSHDSSNVDRKNVCDALKRIYGQLSQGKSPLTSANSETLITDNEKIMGSLVKEEEEEEEIWLWGIISEESDFQ